MDILHQLILFFADYGYIAVFLVLVACGLGLPIPEDITLVAGGVICGLSDSLINVHYMFIISLIGVLVGDFCMFMTGRILGPRVTKLPFLRRIFTDKIYNKMQEKAHRYGPRILFVARFLPGLRAPIYVTAGISRKVSYLKFLLMDGSAALISVPIWVYAGYYFAYDLDLLVHWVKKSEVLIISILAFVILMSIFFAILRHKKRKLNKN